MHSAFACSSVKLCSQLPVTHSAFPRRSRTDLLHFVILLQVLSAQIMKYLGGCTVASIAVLALLCSTQCMGRELLQRDAAGSNASTRSLASRQTGGSSDVVRPPRLHPA